MISFKRDFKPFLFPNMTTHTFISLIMYRIQNSYRFTVRVPARVLSPGQMRSFSQGDEFSSPGTPSPQSSCIQ